MTEYAELLGDDLVWGAPAIAKELGRNTRVAYWLLETGKLPAVKVGKQWVISRRKLREVFGLQEVA